MCIIPIIKGDPWFSPERNIELHVTDSEFYLSPPKEFISKTDSRILNREISFKDDKVFRSHFNDKDHFFDMSLDFLCDAFPEVNFREVLEFCRKKVYIDFLCNENGCYFNNKKYGVEKIFLFSRTADLCESPILEMNLFTTDYFTHRVMKAVCDILIHKKNYQFCSLRDFNIKKEEKIFFTSLGIDILVSDALDNPEGAILFTKRSSNAANASCLHTIAPSMIEGISLKDYDTEINGVNLKKAVLRGLYEELGISEEQLDFNSLKFLDLIINKDNLEIGITGVLCLKSDVTVDETMSKYTGRDELLEVAEKFPIRRDTLTEFLRDKEHGMLSVTSYLISAFNNIENMGKMVTINSSVKLPDEIFCIGKDGKSTENGDHIYKGLHYYAVFDGATPKGTRLWCGMPGDVFVSKRLCLALSKLPADSDARSVILSLNDEIKKCYSEVGLSFDMLLPEEWLQVSAVIYSKKRREIWNFGDCCFKINQTMYTHTKTGDKLLSDLRAFFNAIFNKYVSETEKKSRLSLPDRNERLSLLESLSNEHDPGRAAILPFLKLYPYLANQPGEFGYTVLNGGEINASKVSVYPVKEGDRIILSSDGYPKLFDTLAETEAYLKTLLQADPECVNELRGTKGVAAGMQSFDDRSYLSFYAD